MSENTKSNVVVDDWNKEIRTPDEAMRSALRNPEVNWPLVSPPYRMDRSFVAQFIREAHTLPNKSDLERSLSQDVRLSREVALAFLSRSDFIELYATRQLFLPQHLNQDTEVVTQYVRKIPRALQQADPTLTDNVDVVLAAVDRDGLELQYASRRLQCDETVVRAACSRNPLALDCCWFSAREKLFNDTEFLLQIFRKGGGNLMRKVTNPTLLADPVLWGEAVVNGLPARYVPSSFPKEFWVGVLARNADVYLQLDAAKQQCPDLGMAVCQAENVNRSLLENIRSSCPSLFERPIKQVALVVAKHGSFVEEYLDKHEMFRRDEDVMVEALHSNPLLYNQVVDFSLKRNVKIVRAAISKDTASAVLQDLDINWLRTRPEIAVHAMQTTPLNIQTANAIPEELWSESRELALTWTQQGGSVLGVFAHRLQNDRELAMAVAANSHLDWPRISEDFRNDLDFVLEAVTKNGWNYLSLSGDLRSNWEVQVRAVSSHHGCIASEPHRRRLAVHVSDTLAQLETFRNVLMMGIHDSSSPLHALHIDLETATALKKRLAEWLGVPIGPLSHIYRKCELKLRDNSPRCAVRSGPTPTDFLQIDARLRQDGIPTQPPPPARPDGGIRAMMDGGRMIDPDVFRIGRELFGFGMHQLVAREVERMELDDDVEDMAMAFP